ncbi:IPTL-CTERM sorting domain-containing protein [Comamonas serinivorans]|nr:IPTL-CTERM sorting domain-containing protein [Comamonas serinivorans]
MNASGSALPPRLRTSQPLVRALLLTGLLSAQAAWAGTWTITFTPQQTLDTPPEPVFSWMPPSPPPSGNLFGGRISCSGGTISMNPAGGVHALPSGSPTEAFVAFTQVLSSPSTVAVTVTPDTEDPATCRLEYLAYTYVPGSGIDPSLSVPTTLHSGYVRYVSANADPTDGYSLTGSLPAVWDTGVIFQEDHATLDITIESSVTASSATASNVFVNAKTTAATVAFELTHPQPTDSTITFTVTETPQTFQDAGGDTVYAPLSEGYEATYGTPTTFTVTIPAGSTAVSVPIPHILPGSQVTITPTNHPGDIVGTPTLIQTSPLVIVGAGPTANVVATPNSPGPFPDTTPTNVIDFRVVLDVPPVVMPATPQPVPTLGAWGLGLLGSLLAGFAAWRRPARRRA